MREFLVNTSLYPGAKAFCNAHSEKVSLKSSGVKGITHSAKLKLHAANYYTACNHFTYKMVSIVKAIVSIMLRNRSIMNGFWGNAE